MRPRLSRVWISLLAAAVVLALGVVSASSLATTAPHVPGPNSPNHRLTPGAHFAVGKATICKSGYSASVRDVPASEKRQVFALYHLKPMPGGYEVDHLVSLELGGSNAVSNLWPEHYYDPWGARTKDRLENALHKLVCSDQLSLAQAQREEAANWIRAYKGYVGDANASNADVPAAPVVTGTAVTTDTPVTTDVTVGPGGATAMCEDGTYSYSQTRSGTCSHHGGVLIWYSPTAPAPPATTVAAPPPVVTSPPPVTTTTVPPPVTVTPPPVTTDTTPVVTTGPPAGATALCKDGTYSYSATHSGSCSHHGGVAIFYS